MRPIVALTALAAAVLVLLGGTLPTAAAPTTTLSRVPLAIAVTSPDTASYFSGMAWPADLALIPSTRQAFLLKSITAGHKAQGFASWADAQPQLASLKGQVDVVSYDPEHWAQTPTSEQSNLVATVKQARQDAHAAGFRFLLVPDRNFDQQYVKQLAPYADLYVFQGQRLQSDPAQFGAWMGPMLDTARAANPQAKLYAQVGATDATADQLIAALTTIQGKYDGICVWVGPTGLDTLKAFVGRLT